MGSLLDYSKIFSRTKEIKLHIPHTILGTSVVFTKTGFPHNIKYPCRAVITCRILTMKVS